MTPESTQSLPIRVEKPWGHELIIAWTDRYVGKVLFIRAGHSLSLQYHQIKDETIYMVGGQMEFEVEENGVMTGKRLGPGQPYRIRPGVRHRMKAVDDCTLFEVSTPELDDVVRIEDLYGRATPTVAGA